jgi:cation transport ATPase
MVFLTSAASAEVYRWEDANGMNFTDNFSSVPEKYREKSSAETNEPSAETHMPSGGTNPQVRVGMYRQNRVVAVQENQAAVHQAGLEQQRRAAEGKKQRQKNARDLEDTLQSLVKYIVIGIMLGVCLFAVWIAAIVDITRSVFITSLIKTVWMLLVIFLPLIGMLLYIILGTSQKNDSVSCMEKQRPQLPARPNPGVSKTRQFAL